MEIKQVCGIFVCYQCSLERFNFSHRRFPDRGSNLLSFDCDSLAFSHKNIINCTNTLLKLLSVSAGESDWHFILLQSSHVIVSRRRGSHDSYELIIHSVQQVERLSTFCERENRERGFSSFLSAFERKSNFFPPEGNFPSSEIFIYNIESVESQPSVVADPEKRDDHRSETFRILKK